MPASIAILGGGISGLAAAHRLQELAGERAVPLDVTLYERDAAIGGCVQTLRENGLVMELGPDSLLADKPAAAALLRRTGLEGEIVEMRPEFKGARIVHAGALRPIPSEFRLFTPASIPALLRSGIFSPPGIARAALEPLIPPRKAPGDESLASFVRRRFGREMLDRLAQPLIGGIYSGDPERLSMNATLPQFPEMERRYGSLMRGMALTPRRPPPRLVSLRNGLGSIVETLRASLGDRIRTGMTARQVGRSGERWSVSFEDGSQIVADAVVCATPAYAAAELLGHLDPGTAQLLQRIRYNSIATINLAYDRASATALPAATGFIAPFVERRNVTAATFSSQKYPNRAPEDLVLLRAFVGGALQPDLVDRSDEELVTIARQEFEALAFVRGEPRRAIVTRWRRFLPEYGVGHLELVRELERRLGAFPGIALAGSAYRGVGVPDCIASGEAGAESVFGYIRA